MPILSGLPFVLFQLFKTSLIITVNVPELLSPYNKKNLEKILALKEHNNLVTKVVFKEGNWLVEVHGCEGDILFIGHCSYLLDFAPQDVIPTFKMIIHL